MAHVYFGLLEERDKEFVISCKPLLERATLSELLQCIRTLSIYAVTLQRLQLQTTRVKKLLSTLYSFRQHDNFMPPLIACPQLPDHFIFPNLALIQCAFRMKVDDIEYKWRFITVILNYAQTALYIRFGETNVDAFNVDTDSPCR